MIVAVCRISAYAATEPGASLAPCVYGNEQYKAISSLYVAKAIAILPRKWQLGHTRARWFGIWTELRRVGVECILRIALDADFDQFSPGTPFGSRGNTLGFIENLELCRYEFLGSFDFDNVSSQIQLLAPAKLP